MPTAALWLLWAFLAASSGAAEWHEDFESDPLARGWSVRGDASLFAWDPANGRLAVTWDSTRTNSFFFRPLGATLARSDSFAFRCRLQLDDLQTPAETGTFQLALGFLRQERAFRPTFLRGSGVHPSTGPKDLVEFNYFPAGGSIASTFAAVAIGTNNLRWTTLHAFPFEMVPGKSYELQVSFDATDQTLSLEVTSEGKPYLSQREPLTVGFTDFRIDAFSITSYSGAGQPAGYGGTLLAHGWVDDVHLAYPDPPRLRLEWTPHGDGRRLSLPSTPGWTPVVERSTNLHLGPWETVEMRRVDRDQVWEFEASDTPEAPALFYRVRLERP